MMRQIEAEELMQEEIDLDGDENVVAEAEQMYREALMEVKALSIKLVLADKAFALVRARMEKLVQTIESLLVQLEDGEEYAGDDDDDVQSEDEEGDSYASQGSQDERVKLAERAKRAEMSAELAVREALQAKQEAEKVKADKQREIDDLKVSCRLSLPMISGYNSSTNSATFWHSLTTAGKACGHGNQIAIVVERKQEAGVRGQGSERFALSRRRQIAVLLI